MAVKIQSDQIQNLQELCAVVAGPKDANRLFIIDGQFHSDLVVSSQGKYHTINQRNICCPAGARFEK